MKFVSHIAIFLFGLAVISFLLFLSGEVSEDISQNGTISDQATENGAMDRLDGYAVFESTMVSASLLIPEGAETSEPTEGRLSVKYLGPNNEPNTETTDGFTFTIFRDTQVATGTALQGYTNARISELTERGLDVIAPLSDDVVGDIPAQRFVHGSELGTEVTVYTFMPAPGIVYQVSYTISGTSTAIYEVMVETMLDSLQFLPR